MLFCILLSVSCWCGLCIHAHTYVYKCVRACMGRSAVVVLHVVISGMIVWFVYTCTYECVHAWVGLQLFFWWFERSLGCSVGSYRVLLLEVEKSGECSSGSRILWWVHSSSGAGVGSTICRCV